MSTEAIPTEMIPDNNEEDEKERSRIVRLRENKRRSRARQKEYVQQLERRCREYEQAHVQATVEMQAAARKVAGENRLLRALLKKLGQNDHSIDEWLESHGEAKESRTLNHSLRRRSESSATAMNSGSHQGEGLLGHQYDSSSRLETINLEHTQHYPVLDISSLHSPSSPQTNHVPLLFQPTHHTHHGLQISEPQAQSYTYNSTSCSTFTSGASTPTASTVASSPRLAMDSSFNSFFPAISSPPLQPQFSPASPHLERLSADNKPLVYIRLDPTNDLYKLYPMSTIAIIPWLHTNAYDGSISDQDFLNHHIANLNVSASGAQCLSPKGSTEQLFPSPHIYGIPYTHAHFTPKEVNLSLDDMARRPSDSWGAGYDI
ncbi:hypothetical protein EV426DRAFT_225497 [Tirmania nivea]|nr:hypothetical protein EV426DRAFT_225497 [Tirmania nivea]